MSEDEPEDTGWYRVTGECLRMEGNVW
jgi:hypothetical protein